MGYKGTIANQLERIKETLERERLTKGERELAALLLGDIIESLREQEKKS